MIACYEFVLANDLQFVSFANYYFFAPSDGRRFVPDIDDNIISNSGLTSWYAVLKGAIILIIVAGTTVFHVVLCLVTSTIVFSSRVAEAEECKKTAWIFHTPKFCHPLGFMYSVTYFVMLKTINLFMSKLCGKGCLCLLFHFCSNLCFHCYAHLQNPKTNEEVEETSNKSMS